jgi:alkylated DNA repair dioxygenase AlkB
MIAPQGFAYYPDFLDKKEAKALFEQLLAADGWAGVSASPGARRVLQYGKSYTYSTRGLAGAPAIPAGLAGLVPLEGESPPWDQIIANRYLPGETIQPHIDHTRHFGACVACISLGAAAVVTFATPAGATVYRQRVEPGSLYVMAGDARYRYTHQAAAPHGGIRISVTYRTLGPETEAKVRAPLKLVAPQTPATLQAPADNDPIWRELGF